MSSFSTCTHECSKSHNGNEPQLCYLHCTLYQQIYRLSLYCYNYLVMNLFYCCIFMKLSMCVKYLFTGANNQNISGVLSNPPAYRPA